MFGIENDKVDDGGVVEFEVWDGGLGLGLWEADGFEVAVLCA